MDEITQEVREEAADVAADVAVPVAAIAAEAAAENAAERVADEAIDRIEDLVEHVEEIVDEQEEDRQWQQFRSELAQSESRVMTAIAELRADLQVPSLTPLAEELTELPTFPSSSETLTEEPAASSPAVEEVTLDPLAVAPGNEPEAGRRRVRGLRGKRP